MKLISRNRQGRAPKSSLVSLHVERLESRQLLAGDVLATVSGSTLFVTGDSQANNVIVSQVGNELQVVSGADSTSVAVNGSLSGVSTVSVDLGDGNDVIEFRDLDISRNLLVGGGSGSKLIVIDNVILREILIENNAAAHSVSVSGSTLSRNLGLVTGSGYNSLTVSNSNVSGKVALRREVDGSPVGTSQVSVDQSVIKDLRVTDDFADTTIDVTNSTLNGRIVVLDGVGSLELDIEASDVARGGTIADETGSLWAGLVDASFSGSFWLRADGAGDHSLALQDSHISGNVSFNSIDGVSSVYLLGNSRVTRSLTLEEQGGANSAVVISDNSYVGRRLRHTIVGGGDNETLVRDDAVVAGTLQAANLEGRSNVRILENAEIGRFVGSGYVRQRNVEFAERDGEPILADVYIPKSVGPHPAVILVHGGYWRFGNKSNMANEAKHLAQRGYVAISVDYRLAPADKFPAQIHDVKSAIMWSRENAATYAIDVDNIGIYGYSAGAHLSLLAGMTDPSAGLEGPDAGTFSSEVQAIVGGGAGTDFRDVGLNDTRFEYFFGGTRAELPDLYEDASPAQWVSADDPATFLFVGENDTVINQTKLQQFQQDLDAVGVANEYYVAPGKSHLGAAADKLSRQYAARFLDGQLK